MRYTNLATAIVFGAISVALLMSADPQVQQVSNSLTKDNRLAPGILADIVGSDLVFQLPSSPSASIRLTDAPAVKLEARQDGGNSVPESLLSDFNRDAIGLARASTVPTSVTINGRPAAILFEDAKQLMIHVPYDTAVGPATLRVDVGGVNSNAFPLTISPAAPSIYTNAATGFAVARNSAGQIISPTNPAKTGDFITVEAIGLGTTTPPVTAGVATPSTPPAVVDNPVTVRFLANPPVSIAAERATLIPGRIGVYQVFFRPPASLPAGATSLQLIAANSTSNTVPFSVLAVAPPVTCTYTISPQSAAVGPGGGAGDFALTTDPVCGWTASAGVSWISVSPGSGTGPARLTYRVGANSDPASRSGTVAVAGATGTAPAPPFEITQAGTPTVVLPLILLSNRQLTFSAVANGSPPAPQSVNISSSADQLAFSLSASDSWIRVTPGSSTTRDSAAITVDSRQLSAGTYRGFVSVRASGASNSPERIEVTATVSDPPSTGTLRLDEEMLNFAWPIGGISPAPATVTVGSTGPPIGFRVAPIVRPAGVRWLTVGPTTGTTPALVDVSVNVTTLDEGGYDSELVFTPNDAKIPPVSLPVHIQVNKQIQPKLQPEANQLTFSFPQGTAADQQLLTVTNPSDNVIRFDVSAKTDDGGSWLKTSGARRSVDRSRASSVLVVVEPYNLAPGSYRGSVTMLPDSGDPVQVPVLVVVSRSTRRIEVSQSSMLFRMEAGSSAGDVDQKLNIRRTGTGAMPWSATATTLGGGPWLVIRNQNDVSNTDPGGSVLTVGIKSLNLPAGLYEGSIRIDAPDTENGPAYVRVQLDVRQKGDIGPRVDTAGLVFTGVAGGPAPTPQEINITNLGSKTITYNAIFNPSDNSSGVFASIDPPTGRLGPPGITPGAAPFSQKVKVSVNTAGLSAGIFRGSASFTFPDGVNRVINILLVLSPPGGSASTAKGEKAADGCAAHFLTPVFTSLEDRLNVSSDDAVVTQLAIVDDCGRILTQGAVSIVFSNGDRSISLRPLGSGQWGTTWQVQNESQRIVRMEVLALDPSQSVEGVTGLRANVTSIGDGPVVRRDGVTAFDNSGGSGVIPGALMRITGARLADRSESAPANGELPTVLGGVRVLLGETEAGLQSVSSNQIVAMVPPDAIPNTTLSLVVVRGERISLPLSVIITGAP